MNRQDQAPGTVALTVPSHPKFLKVIRRVMELYLEEMLLSKDEVPSLILAVDEACSNIIKYAYDYDEMQTITVTFLCTDGRLKITIRDFGKKPDLKKIKPRALDDIRPGGLGTHIIQSVMDHVDYDTSPETGTLLTLIKRLK